MLQQTRVDTVLGFYEPFLERFPSVEALAGADLDEVLSAWSGLGYYRRARSLHAAAIQIVESGRFPCDRASLRKLPGIGEYASAAIASIAFGEKVPVVDGNVDRVASRLLALATDPSLKEGRVAIVERAASLLTEDDPGDGNQAMMELGATVCLPRSPVCSRCPISSGCRARAQGDPESYPVRRKAAPQTKVRRVTAFVRSGERMLLSRVPEGSARLAGLWEFPSTDVAGTLAQRSAALSATYGGKWKLGRRLGSIRHTITRTDYEVEIRSAELRETGAIAEGPELAWFDATELESLATAASVGKIVAAVRTS